MSPASSASAWRGADRLLAEALHVERDLLLALRDQHAGVEDARLHHRAQAACAAAAGSSCGSHGPTAWPSSSSTRISAIGQVGGVGGRDVRSAAGAPRRRARGAGRRNRSRSRAARWAPARADAVVRASSCASSFALDRVGRWCSVPQAAAVTATRGGKRCRPQGCRAPHRGRDDGTGQRPRPRDFPAHERVDLALAETAPLAHRRPSSAARTWAARGIGATAP